MMIHIPDEYFEREIREAFIKMPPTPNTNPENRKRSSPVLHHVGKQMYSGNLCITVTMIYKAVLNELKKRKIIIYDPAADTWQGVDYDDN